MKNIIYIFISLFSVISFSQKKDLIPNFNDYIITDKDSLFIELNEVAILPKHKFKSNTDINYYKWFRRKVFKAYPYAVLASKRIDSVNNRLKKIKKKRNKRKYIKKVQNYVENELTAPLKKLTRTEGRILLKLIHRQTGKTAFSNVKELRNGWRAFWYNTTANLFKLSLKSEYNPLKENEDYLIEDVLQRAFLNDELEKQIPKLEFDYFKILSEKKGEVNVEDYKKMFAKMKKRKNK